MNIVIPEINWASIAPELILFSTAMIVLMLGAIFPRISGRQVSGISLLGVLAAFVATVLLWGRSEPAFSKMIVLDNFGLFFNVIFLICMALTILVSIDYFDKTPGRTEQPEYYGLLMFACVGMMFMAAGADLIVIFLGLETMSISVYILAGFLKDDLKGNEAAIKYLLLGAFSTGFLLYGIALIFGATGSTNLAAIYENLRVGASLSSPMIVFGMALLIVGFGFKVAAVPFHMWMPDVYEGSPTVVTAFMSAGVKAAAFAAFLRVFVYALPALQPHWTAILWALAILTMTVGNLAALLQENIKRMLAYSSIAHAGYIMIGLTVARHAADDIGTYSILYYLLAYTFMTMGSFIVVILYGRHAEENLNISDYAGMGYKYPLLGVAMAVFMFSLAGIPPMAGFVGKFYIFAAAVKGGYIDLAVIGIINSILSVYYYLRVTVMIYMREPAADAPVLKFSRAATLATVIAAAATLILGIVPGTFISLARQSITMILG
jgi:NADH-quinone oxidoreductase subunit N